MGFRLCAKCILEPLSSRAREDLEWGGLHLGGLLSVPGVTAIAAWLCRYLSFLAWP